MSEQSPNPIDPYVCENCGSQKDIATGSLCTACEMATPVEKTEGDLTRGFEVAYASTEVLEEAIGDLESDPMSDRENQINQSGKESSGTERELWPVGEYHSCFECGSKVHQDNAKYDERSPASYYVLCPDCSVNTEATQSGGDIDD
jgi:DNA-directed RNA polymerase subunit RPC12/RpoP